MLYGHVFFTYQCAQPIVVVGSINGAAPFMIGLSWLRGETDAADARLVPSVKQILTCGGAHCGVEGDVVVLRNGSGAEGVGSGGLQLVHTGAVAVDPLRIQSLEGIAATMRILEIA